MEKLVLVFLVVLVFVIAVGAITYDKARGEMMDLAGQQAAVIAEQAQANADVLRLQAEVLKMQAEATQTLAVAGIVIVVGVMLFGVTCVVAGVAGGLMIVRALAGQVTLQIGAPVGRRQMEPGRMPVIRVLKADGAKGREKHEIAIVDDPRSMWGV